MPPSRRTPETPADRWVDAAAGRPLDEEDRGLAYDLGTLVSRRRTLGLFGALGATALVAACSGTSDTSSSASTPSGTGTGSSSSGSGDLTEVPDETGGPFPGDGSNGVDVLDDSGIVRKDIRSGFGSSTATAAGVPLTVRLTVRDAATGSARNGAAVYVWHCDRDGGYSLYSSGLETSTTCAACSPPARAARSSSPRSSRGRTRAGGRTSTSRSTSRWTARRRRARS